MYSYTPAPLHESDDSLRARLDYIAGEVSISGPTRVKLEILNATGSQLDDIAWRYGLKRRAA